MEEYFHLFRTSNVIGICLTSMLKARIVWSMIQYTWIWIKLRITLRNHSVQFILLKQCLHQRCYLSFVASVRWMMRYSYLDVVIFTFTCSFLQCVDWVLINERNTFHNVKISRQIHYFEGRNPLQNEALRSHEFLFNSLITAETLEKVLSCANLPMNFFFQWENIDHITSWVCVYAFLLDFWKFNQINWTIFAIILYSPFYWKFNILEIHILLKMLRSNQKKKLEFPQLTIKTT